MSKSLKRVRQALSEAGIEARIIECTGETRTAAQAAEVVGCALDQIAKSIVFVGAHSGRVHLFITAGGNRVSPEAASRAAGEPLKRADADLVRRQTGFAIGGVAPVGHLSTVPSHFDPRLMQFAEIWAAAGTPRHLFAVEPGTLLRISGAQLSDFTE